MKYYSLNNKSIVVDFKTATINGQAPDKGLYFPERIPQLNKQWFVDIENKSNEQIAFDVIQPYIGNCIPDNLLFEIVSETVNFPIPLQPITSSISSLELFHGPTLAFKDVGARFMSRCLGYFSKEKEQELLILVATSGDTGAAVANGFYNVPGVKVLILFPSGKVSSVQEKQLTTLGNNIHALEVEGSFDDCQALVKQAFFDKELNKKVFLTSANSINVARWLPQQFYYFFAYKQLAEKNNPPIIAVPSGNFGNICAGILAQQSGLPIQHFIAACNANDTVPEFLQTHQYTPKSTVATISNAMDVSDPSNFVRIQEIFQQNVDAIKSNMSSCSISDVATKATIKSVYQEHNYLLDPHGAVGYLALENYLKEHPQQKGIFLETAHPIKFYNVIEPIIQQTLSIQDSIKATINKPSLSKKIQPTYNNLLECIEGLM
ncbi:MAG: threonine synthase [Chitinophagaceae bacterium]|nr:threonine synthase [Chitinophagaceae bacterium]